MPASTWIAPPYASATPKTIGSPAAGSRPALNRLSRNVVSAKQPRPSGAGSAIIRTFSEASSLAMATRPAVGSLRSARNSLPTTTVCVPASGVALTATARLLLVRRGERPGPDVAVGSSCTAGHDVSGLRIHEAPWPPSRSRSLCCARRSDAEAALMPPAAGRSWPSGSAGRSARLWVSLGVGYALPQDGEGDTSGRQYGPALAASAGTSDQRTSSTSGAVLRLTVRFTRTGRSPSHG